MIETTFIRLEKAAEMLGTDADTLLIAGTEGRIRLYGLLNMFLSVHKQEWIDGYPHVVDVADLPFNFIPLNPDACGNVVCKGDTGEIYYVSEPDEHGLKWEIAAGNLYREDLDADDWDQTRIGRGLIFARRSDIESIKATNMAPEAGTVEHQKNPQRLKGAETRSRDTLLSIISAMADQLGIDPTGRGSAARIAEWTEHVGAPVSEETIKKYLHMIPDTIERRRK